MYHKESTAESIQHKLQQSCTTTVDFRMIQFCRINGNLKNTDDLEGLEEETIHLSNAMISVDHNGEYNMSILIVKAISRTVSFYIN